MNTRELLKAACTILGLFHIVWGLVSVNWIADVFIGPRGVDFGRLSGQWAIVATVPVYVITGIILFKYADGLAGWLSKRAAAIDVDLKAGWSASFYEAALPVVGVVVVVYALPELVRECVRAWFYIGNPVGRFPVNELVTVGAAALRICLGVYLMSGGRKFREIIERFRQASAAESQPT